MNPHERRQLRSDGILDQVAVDRAVAGDVDVPLTRAELRAAWQILEANDLPAAVIAERLGVAERTVWRWRRAVGGRAPARRPLSPAPLPAGCWCPTCERFPGVRHTDRHALADVETHELVAA